jgi:hypothetical protein
VSLLQSNSNGFQWYTSLEDAQADGFAVVKVYSLLAFFMLKPRVSVISLDNLEVIPNLFYLYEGRESDDAPLKYYKKSYRNWTADMLFFYRQSLIFSGDDDAINIFRRRCGLGEVYLLLTGEQVEDTTAMLKRLYKSQFKEEGKLKYKIYLALAETSLRFSDYQQIGKDLTGYRTTCSIFEREIKNLWDKAKINPK